MTKQTPTELDEWTALAAAVRDAGPPPEGWVEAHKRGAGGEHSKLLATGRALLSKYRLAPVDAATQQARANAVLAFKPLLDALGATRA